MRTAGDVRIHTPLNNNLPGRTWQEAGDVLKFGDHTGAMNTAATELADCPPNLPAHSMPDQQLSGPTTSSRCQPARLIRPETWGCPWSHASARTLNRHRFETASVLEDDVVTMSKRYPPEVREKAVRLALARLDEYGSPYAAAKAIGPNVEFALMEWTDWYNNARLHSRLGYLPSAECETVYYSQQPPRRPALV
jgi:hypothetical protein